MSSPFENNKFEIVWLAADLESLSKVTFIRILENAKRKYKSPREFFSTIGIVIPSSVKSWADIDEYYLIKLKEITYIARQQSELKGIIISSTGRIIEHGSE